MHVQHLTFERILYERRGNGNDFGHCHKRLLLERINGSLLGNDLIGFDRYRQRHREILGGGKYGRSENRGLHDSGEIVLHHAKRRYNVGYLLHPHGNKGGNGFGNGYGKSFGDKFSIGNLCDLNGHT